MAKVTLKERQDKAVDQIQRRLGESIKERMKIDPSEIPWDGEEFSIKTFKENFDRKVANKFLESNPESMFGQLLRFGVQNFMFDAYKSITDFIYTDIVNSRPSKGRQEWYAPMYGVEVS